MPSSSPIANLAAELSDDERKVVLWAFEANHVSWGNRVSCWGDQELARRLFDKGLLRAPTTFDFLTETGLAVREILTKEKSDGQ